MSDADRPPASQEEHERRLAERLIVDADDLEVTKAPPIPKLPPEPDDASGGDEPDS